MMIKKIFFTHIPYDGYFSYKDEIKLYPSMSKIEEDIGHKPSIIEFKVEEGKKEFFEEKKRVGKVKFPVPKDAVQAVVANNRYHELLRLFSLFTNYHHFTYKNHQSWCIHLGTKGFKRDSINWGQEIVPSFIKMDFNPKTPVAESQEMKEYYGGMAIEKFTPTVIHPENLATLLEKYFTFSDEMKDVFDKSLRLFNQALEIMSTMPSLSIVAYISSIENLVTHQHLGEPEDTCDCGQIKYGVSKKFKSFICDSIKAESNRKRNKYVDMIYDLRSKIVHAGGLHLNDLDNYFWKLNEEENPFLLFEIEQITRISIINWFIKQ
jgi:hypothetical protein